jgi:hypothetical protein
MMSSMTMRIDRRIAAVFLALALLLQGPVVAAMDCHGDQTRTIVHDYSAVNHSHDHSAVDHSHHQIAADHLHDDETLDHSHQGCAYCASGCLMTVVTSDDLPAPPQAFKSPSPSVITSVLATGEAPDGLLRPPR